MKMARVALVLAFIFSQNLVAGLYAGPGLPTKKVREGNIYIVSVGINGYGSMNFANCEQDARRFVKKVSDDNLQDSIISFLLLNKNATKDSLREVLLLIGREARPEDAFLFFFAGCSWELKLDENNTLISQNPDDETYLLLQGAPWPPHYENFIRKNPDGKYFNHNHLFAIKDLAKFFEQIAASEQLIVSEAGMGNSFRQNLVSEMFEYNPYLVDDTSRNRIVLTTNKFGYDNTRCKGEYIQTGPLMHYIHQSGDLMDIFKDHIEYEYRLENVEVGCNYFNYKYWSLNTERDAKGLLKRVPGNPGTRGTKLLEAEPEAKANVRAPKVFALIMGNNQYQQGSGWENLKNPINDAREFAEVMKSRFGVDTRLLENVTKDSFTKFTQIFKREVDSSDMLIFFVAGHGYYSDVWSDGYLVFKNCPSVKDDPNLDTYLPLARLERLLDGFRARNVFVVLDVCYGATFDLNARDIALTNYSDFKSDLSIAEFAQRENAKKSRIYLASGRYTVFDFWKGSLNHSPFADKILRNLKAEGQFASPGKLYSALKGNINEPFLKRFGGHEERGDFVLPVK